MSSQRWLWMLLVPILMTVVYLWPIPRKRLEELARTWPVPEKERLSLETFRQEHPPKVLLMDGVTWEYTVFGEGPDTVLFLHGMAGAYDIWWQQMEDLASDFRVVSVTYPPVDSLEGLAQGLERVLDREGIDRTALVGTSLGGYLAQYFIKTRPQRVTKVVLGNTFPPNTLYLRQYRPIVSLAPFLPEWMVLGIFRQGFFQRVHPSSQSNLLLIYLLEQTYGSMRKEDVVSRARCVLDVFEPPDLEALGIPVLIIESANDPLVPPELRAQLKALYPNAQVYTFSDAGHFPYVNRGETYNQLLRNFLVASK